MPHEDDVLTIRFSRMGDEAYRVELQRADIGERSGDFTPPFDEWTWRVIWRALDPSFDLEKIEDKKAKEAIRKTLKTLGGIENVPAAAGRALADALFAGDEIRDGFDFVLNAAAGARQIVPVEMRFGKKCDAVAALPWNCCTTTAVSCCAIDPFL